MSVPTSSTNRSKGNAVYTLSLNDILSDLDKLPNVDQSSAAPSHSESLKDEVETVPASSDSMESSIDISLRFIASSQKLLVDSVVMEDVSKRLERVDEDLQDVESSLKA